MGKDGAVGQLPSRVSWAIRNGFSLSLLFYDESMTTGNGLMALNLQFEGSFAPNSCFLIFP